jgi:serine/threonine-protein kinase
LCGRFRVLSRIGSGGVGEVFDAEHIPSKKRVALKILRPAHRDVETIARLRREGSVISSIRHKNVCRLYDIASMPDGSPILVLQRLVGQTLHETFRRRQLRDPDEVVAVFVQMLAGLEAVHSFGILHRDLKPGNVFLVDKPDRSPRAKLLDFGFAKQAISSGYEALTQPGRVCGTPIYMSPEQLRGEPVSTSSDLFSIGLMLFEALTGQHPFGGPGIRPLEVSVRILREDCRRIQSLRPSLPDGLDEIVQRALAKSPKDRFSSASEMKQALQTAALEDPDMGAFSADPIPRVLSLLELASSGTTASRLSPS